MDKPIQLSKMKFRDYYHLFQEKAGLTPTAVKSWARQCFDIECKWQKLFQNIPRLSTNNRLRKFSFKMLHCILVTKNELKQFKIADNEECFFFCVIPLIPGQKLFQEVLTWFNNKHKVNFSPSKLQVQFKDYDPPQNTNSKVTRKFQILTVQTQKYYYSCKMLKKTLQICYN